MQPLLAHPGSRTCGIREVGDEACCKSLSLLRALFACVPHADGEHHSAGHIERVHARTHHAHALTYTKGQTFVRCVCDRTSRILSDGAHTLHAPRAYVQCLHIWLPPNVHVLMGLSAVGGVVRHWREYFFLRPAMEGGRVHEELTAEGKVLPFWRPRFPCQLETRTRPACRRSLLAATRSSCGAPGSRETWSLFCSR